jgi:hypothetical protein
MDSLRMLKQGWRNLLLTILSVRCSNYFSISRPLSQLIAQRTEAAYTGGMLKQADVDGLMSSR